MNFRIGAHVDATDGRVGEITKLIIDSRDRTVSDIVVKEGRFAAERLVPIEDIVEATSDAVKLRVSHAQFNLLPPYARSVQYTPDTPPDSYLGVVKNPVVLDQVDIGENERWFTGGEKVEATDGTVGKIDEVLVDDQTRKITDVVLREGHLWSRHHVTIPIDNVDYAARGVIYLKLSKAELEPLKKLVEA